MNLYFVFKGDGYYPLGGWDDDAQICYTKTSAIKTAKEIGWGQWSHIVEWNISQLKAEIIKRYNVDNTGPGKLMLREVSVDYMRVIEEWEVE